MKRISMILVFGLLFFFSLIGQEKLIVKGDTLVTLTGKQLSTVNGIIESYEWTLKENKLLEKKIATDSARLAAKDSIIVVQKEIEKKKEAYYIEQSEELVRQNMKLQELNESLRGKYKKRTWIIGGAAGILGLLVGILIGK